MDPQNPLGILEIDHIEFTTNDLTGKTSKLFQSFGFLKTLRNEKENAELYSQGQCRFLLVKRPDPQAQSSRYFEKHGEGVSKLSYLVENTHQALDEATKRGAKAIGDIVELDTAEGKITIAQIKGFGDVVSEFISRPKSFFRPDYQPSSSPEDFALKTRAARIDHLTHNVPKGEMDHWAEFYQRVFGFEEIRTFDIKGMKTGLLSRAMGLPNKRVVIPINEPEVFNGQSQIQEFLDLHRGAGVQHIALSTPDIVSTVSELRERGIRFLDIPSTYYEDIPKRPFAVEEDIPTLEKNQILVDGDSEGYLLQNFTDTYIGPLFFEIIQRKKHNGFGEGNFTALFEAIERDQIQRGYLK